MRHLFALLLALFPTLSHGSAGAASGMGQAFLAGALEDGHGGTLTQQQRQAALNDAQMLGAFMGYLFSGGDAGNVSLGGSIGQSGMAHNYLSHDQIADLQDELSQCAERGAGFAACRADVLARYVEISADQNAALAACQTDACRADHLARIAVAEGAFDTIVHDLMTSGDANGGVLNDLQYSEADRIDWTPTQVDAFRSALRRETTATFCSGDVSSCDMSVLASLEGYGALTDAEQQVLATDRLNAYLELERQARAEIARDVCSASMSADACGFAVDAEIERQRRLNNRIFGAVDVVFGTAEIAGALYMCPSSGGTACVASFALGVHGFDVAQAGMRQLITGEEVLPVGVQLMMRATGMNATQAGLAYDLVTLGFEMATVRAIANQGENALSLYHQQAFRGGANRTTVSDIGELRPPARPLLEGEDVLIGSAQGLQSRTAGTFDNVVQGTHGDRATTYLYTIDDRGVNIALESTPAGTPRGNIVHTNLSDRAAIGGEAWFGPNNTVTINAGSGRFGDGAGITQQQWDNTVRYWEGLRYTVNPIPFGRR